ncbi:phosphocholine-specific phospholipase C [Sphingomonas sp. R1]|uniref:phosphocholine-specific phospholipase C n=1 Tax=Sphingomonas sp. R1 TaxID=399176 RepID=UPI0022242006|nr:phospholipase C, phosphocholine-specific [Sphingomonas sp. R1]UYY77568.1 phospholipase C, phosphocholine-specific [Sphingomonas sp. R1]
MTGGTTRRRFLASGAQAAALSALPASIARAAAIPADVRTGTIADVAHVVILMQENRSFDHYFGTLRGVRGFGDPLTVPLPGGRSIWAQEAADGRLVAPFHLSTKAHFELMRVAGTPHSWPDAQAAWDQGRMHRWAAAKTERAMGHYTREDLAFQFALAEHFTLCDAYHCAVHTGTNTNRLFLWTGTNDPSGTRGGPSIGNSHDELPEKGGHPDSYRWTTYPERLQAAGIDWRIYQDMADNFTDNPLVGFAAYREAQPGSPLYERARTTHGLDQLRADALAGRLPQVSWVIADAKGSEHPAPSSPAQGAAYTAAVIDALTANPEVWARTVLIVNFDENDGFFDHVPPPAPPSEDPGAPGGYAGSSQIETTGEYHRVPSIADDKAERPELIGRPYGLGPRVPCYVVSPWSRGGWVNSQIFDHTSVLRFLEIRFGVAEPNISAWRRAVCGDLTSAFDFRSPNRPAALRLPDPRPLAARAAALPTQPEPSAPPAADTAPPQEPGVRRSRALPYALEVQEAALDSRGIRLRFDCAGAPAVVHVYDRLRPDALPRRFTLATGGSVEAEWLHAADGRYDLWLLGPIGFHRHFAGKGDALAGSLRWEQLRADTPGLRLQPRQPLVATWPRHPTLAPSGRLPARDVRVALGATGGWYDLILRDPDATGYRRRLAGRIENGKDGWSEPPLMQVEVLQID